ncbi:hypothetical protein [Corynebacterium flavescens]|uniref:hypothetical protein n=1 Tax=Corynebacterium flavescens TaxID=28028 RepID=UPI003FCF318D
MKITVRKVIPLAILLPLAIAWGVSEKQSKAPAPSLVAPAAGEKDTATQKSDAPSAKIHEAGFGQSDTAAVAMVVAQADNPSAVGQFVTATVNFLNADGGIIATKQQVERFSWEGQEIALPVFLFPEGESEIPHVTDIDASVAVSDYSSSEHVQPELPQIDAVSIAPKNQGTSAAFEFTNHNEMLDGLRVGAVCHNAAGDIVGGGSAYPNAIAADSKIRFEVDMYQQEVADTCKAYLNY